MNLQCIASSRVRPRRARNEVSMLLLRPQLAQAGSAALSRALEPQVCDVTHPARPDATHPQAVSTSARAAAPQRAAPRRSTLARSAGGGAGFEKAVFGEVGLTRHAAGVQLCRVAAALLGLSSGMRQWCGGGVCLQRSKLSRSMHHRGC